MQERQKTNLLALQVKHTDDAHLILNLAQLHNADLISIFRPSARYPGLPREEVVLRSVAHRRQLVADAAQKKIDVAHKKAQAAQKKIETAQKKKDREARKAQKDAAAERIRISEGHQGIEVEVVTRGDGHGRVNETSVGHSEASANTSVHGPPVSEGEFSSRQSNIPLSDTVNAESPAKRTRV